MGFREGGGGGGGGVTFAPPSGQIDAGDANSEGASDSATRADHQHAFPGPTGPPGAVAGAGAAGASGRPARQDHTHSHTAAHHLGGGHADLTGAFADINAPGIAVGAHEGDGDPHPGYQLEAGALAAGDVVLQALADAKGDLIAATGADVFARVPAGVDGTFLVADSSQAAGIKYGPGPVGGVTDHGDLTGLADNDHPQYVKGSIVRKSADETVVNNTVLQNDAHLFAALDANKSYVFELTVVYDNVSSTADLKAGFAVPTGATLKWGAVGLAGSASGSPGSAEFKAGAATDAVVEFGTIAGSVSVHFRGTVAVGATAGDLQFRWAQVNSSGNGTTVQAGSVLVVREIV